MSVRRKIGVLVFLMMLSLATGQEALSGDYSREINAADQKVILEQYEEAKEIYRQIIDSADYSVVKAYAHYKLGSLYKRLNEPVKAKAEYKKGLLSLQKAGEAHHQIGKHLTRALQVIG